MKIRPILAWYDLWIGAYWDRKNRCLYLFPLPMIGIKIQLSERGSALADVDSSTISVHAQKEDPDAYSDKL